MIPNLRMHRNWWRIPMGDGFPSAWPQPLWCCWRRRMYRITWLHYLLWIHPRCYLPSWGNWKMLVRYIYSVWNQRHILVFQILTHLSKNVASSSMPFSNHRFFPHASPISSGEAFSDSPHPVRCQWDIDRWQAIGFCNGTLQGPRGEEERQQKEKTEEDSWAEF